MSELFSSGIITTVLAKPVTGSGEVCIAPGSEKYLEPGFQPDPKVRYRWHMWQSSLSSNEAATLECAEYTLLRESRCMEFVSFCSVQCEAPAGKERRYLKDAIKKYAHRHPVAALVSLLHRRNKLLGRLRLQVMANETLVKAVKGILDARPGLQKDLLPGGFDRGTDFGRCYRDDESNVW